MNDKPWLVPSAIEWLDRYLTKDMLAFEWGMGGSTLWYAQRVRILYCVDSDPEWFQKTVADLDQLPQCCEVLTHFISLDDGNKYTDVINQYPSSCFDYIAVDGRRRVECIQHAIPYLKSGGVLLLDNSERPEYKPGIDLMQTWKHIDFVDEWQTSIYVKP